MQVERSQKSSSVSTGQPGIKPELGLFDLTMIIVSLVIGIGIFRTPAIVATMAGTPLIFFSAWILGGIVSICGALTFAEIGSRFPAAGGFYKIFSYCYHPAYAFMLNWSLVITNAASCAGVAIVGAEYINPILMPASLQNNTGIQITAVTVILLLYGLNFLGIKMGSRAQNVLSMVKIVMIIIFCCAIFGVHHTSIATVMPEGGNFNFLKALGVSLISVFFTYGGYQNTINFGADIKEPEKNIPKGIIMGIGIVIVLYLTINFVYFSVLGFEGMQHSKLLASDIASAFFGPGGATFASVAIFISVLGFINTSVMSNPRVYYAMAEDKVLPQIFKRVNPKTMTQEFSLSFFVALTILSLFLLGTFEKILNYVMFIDSISLVSAAFTVFNLRAKAKQANAGRTDINDEHIYKIKLFPWVPLLFMFVLLMVTVNVVVSDHNAAILGTIIFAAGYPLYWGMKKVLE
ncbi:MAG: serine/threonine protein kinase [Bacteroidota bacterium]|nr:serine/threonine protein kinase [Bacteroidota bacterium]